LPTIFADGNGHPINTILGYGPTWLQRDTVLDIFGGTRGFEEFHQGMTEEKELAKLIDSEFDRET
jgi:hypothetical protein